jgi:hypothetical protein
LPLRLSVRKAALSSMFNQASREIRNGYGTTINEEPPLANKEKHP